MKKLSIKHDFSSLSVKDLLEAREAYHLFLTSLQNVVATAVGRYRIHYKDPSAKSPSPADYKEYGESEPRTLSNTVVTSWSWPCVLVFVDKWFSRDELIKNPTELVPRYLYLSDGRIIPTCVLYAQPDTGRMQSISYLDFPGDLIGGGYPCFTDPKDTQGLERVGTLGGLVSRAGTAYALTNHHVAGEAGRPVFRLSKGRKEKIGISDPLHIEKKRFSEIYPGWPGERTYVAMDAGLIRVEDINQWTSQVFGIGEVDYLIDFNIDTITLDLIGTPVRAFCGVSGTNEGEIYGLFYRYRSIGGFDYVSDLLVGPRTDKFTAKKENKKPRRRETQLNIQSGDSGSFLFIDPPNYAQKESEQPESQKRGQTRRLYPIAMLWGGVDFENHDKTEVVPCVMATFLSTIFRTLDIDLLNNHNLGYREYWGKTGHFKVGYKFCDLLSTPILKDLIAANRENIGYPNETLELGKAFSVGRGQFVPLADVPDYVWVGKARYDRIDGPRRNEPLQHFADIDDKAADGGPSLLNMCKKDPDSNLRAQVWYDFYRAFEGLDYGPEMGSLPFRVRQIYEDMVAYVKENKFLHFTAAAGVLSHYVADGCIPLHFSTLHHGRGPQVRRDAPEYADYKKSREYKIHSIFEQKMFETFAVEMNSGIDGKLQSLQAAPTVNGGFEAIKRFFKLMKETYDFLSPEVIVDTDDPSATDKERATLLFENLGAQTVECIVMGCTALAELVESAWKEGDGNSRLNAGDIKTYSEEEVQDMYNSRNFLPALTFEQYIRRGF